MRSSYFDSGRVYSVVVLRDEQPVAVQGLVQAEQVLPRDDLLLACRDLVLDKAGDYAAAQSDLAEQAMRDYSKIGEI
jgi:hypothetical protein